MQRLKEFLRDRLTAKELDELVRGYDRVGDIAIILVPPQLQHLERVVAEAVLQLEKNVSVVARRRGKYSGEYRTLPLDIVAGGGRLQTIHKEFGIRLHVDLEKVYFSPRSADERYRLANLVEEGEHVLVMFSGVAPLPLMIATYSMAATITGIEKNPSAHLLGMRNLQINRTRGNITLYQGDVLQVIPGLSQKFDRIAMPLPVSAGRYLDTALSVLADNGWIHLYDFQKAGELERALIPLFDACSRRKRAILQAAIQRCGHVSPLKYRVCVDAQIV